MVKLTPPLDQIRPRLERAFGNRLRGVILYGSRARGDERPDSDVDLMILLDEPFSLKNDLDRTIDALYALQLESELLIHPMPVDVREYEEQRYAIFREVRREGLTL